MAHEFVFAITNFLALSEALFTCMVFFMIFKISKKYCGILCKRKFYLILAAIPLYILYKAAGLFFPLLGFEMLSTAMLAGSIALLFSGIIVFIEVGKITLYSGMDLNGF